MTLKVTPDQVRSKAREIESHKQTMERLMQAMAQEVTRLPADFWASRSGTNFAERFRSVQQNAQGALNRLITHIRNLNDAANRYDEIERTQEQKVSNLSTQNIFN